MIKTRDFVADTEVRQLVDAFESGTIAPSQFDHAAHMATGLSYLATMSLDQAIARMRRVAPAIHGAPRDQCLSRDDHNFLDAPASSSREWSISGRSALVAH